ncbi:TonB-dependent receptor plug domain-containing protein [Undibacterium sp. Ji67W]|uniref:TonB-dependent receptor plug domain-containing protein n=1 Tax=Undibacterium sp. Ji67W TaxID=3413042 RepID=UPI003BF03797
MNFREKKSVFCVRIALSAIASGMLLGGVAHAQSETEPAKLQKVEITGSNIKRIDAETASPIQVINRADIERSGATSLSSVIQSIASNNTGSLTGVEYNGFSPGASTASLRGLGSGATLVLVNGRRIAQYGITGFQSQFANLDSIPVGAVDRIEVLLDGASAIYGSEAIAGVINIWLRKDYTGADIRLSGLTNQNGKGSNDTVNASYGMGDIAADKYNFFGSFEHNDQAELLMRDINAYQSQDYRGLGFTKGDRRSSYSYPGNVLTPGGFVANPGCDPSDLGVRGGTTRCLLDGFKSTAAVPKSTRDSLFTRGSYEINANHSFFIEAGVTQIKTNLHFDPQFYYNDPNSLLTVGGTSYLYRAGDLGFRKIDVTDTESRVVAGFKGILGNWEYDTAAGFLKSKVNVQSNGLILIDQMEAALANGTYVPGGVNAPSVLRAISPTLQRNGENKSTFVDFKVSNSELFNLPGGSAGIAAGVEYRRESTTDIDDPRFATGNVFGYGGLPALPVSTRTTSSAYAEMNLPVLKSVEASIAGRYDDYSIGGTSFTPKLGLKWNILPSLVWRATSARGFRAPNFREISPAISAGYYNGITDPVRCVTGNENACNLSILANISGNPNLLPEKSNSFTTGIVWEPVKDYSVSIDYYRIERRNEISSLDINYLLTNQADPNYAKYITKRDANGDISVISLPYINIGKTRVSGIDLDFKGKANLGENGKLNFRSQLNFVKEFLTTPFPGSPTVDYNGTYDQPSFRGSVAVAWEKGPWTNEASMSYTSGYSYAASPTDTCQLDKIYGGSQSYCQVKSFAQFNWFTGYKGFKNVEIGVNIMNIFNTSPPFDARSALNNGSFPYNPDYSNPFGRRFGATLKYTFK